MAKKKKKDAQAASAVAAPQSGAEDNSAFGEIDVKLDSGIAANADTEQAGDSDQASIDRFMQQLVNTVASIPAPEHADITAGQDQIDVITEDHIIVSSVVHNTTVIEDAPVNAPGKPLSEPKEPPAQNADVTAPSAKTTDASMTAAEEAAALTDEEKAAIRRDNADFSMIDEAKDNPFRNVFVESLDTVTADDLGKPPKKKKKDPVDVIIELFRKAIFWAAVVAFFVSGYQIVAKLYSYHQAEKIYDIGNIFDALERREDLVATAVRSDRLSALTPVNGTKEESAEMNDAADSSQFNEKLLILQGQLQILRNTNKEIIGWIEMPGDTEINYPVVQHEDNDYYLHYAYNGAYNPAGSIYLDYRNSVAVSSNRHTVIYGHNMESGSPMFAKLLHFKDESFWKNNRYINIYTDEALYTYEVFAAYETSPQQQGVENHSWRMNFQKDDNIFLAWIDSIRARSDISPKVPIEGNDRILTLSTCMNINDNRYVVHAVLVEVVK